MPLHHYLPASYLARFSPDSTTEPVRNRLLAVGDKKNQRCFNAPARRVGCIRNLYTLIDNSKSPELVDQIWTEYERHLPVAVDNLIQGRLTAETWCRVLVPFVACMLVRGPDFNERFNTRSEFLRLQNPKFSLTPDNANVARLMELQRLLACVLAARWIVLTAYGGEDLITNDLGYSPFIHPENGGARGMAIPLGNKSILAIVPEMMDRPIARAIDDEWIPIIEHRDLLPANHQALNRAMAQNALRFVFGSDVSLIQQQIQGLTPALSSPEPRELGFPEELLRPTFEFTWHRLVGAIQRHPSEKDGWDFRMDIKSMSTGWYPAIFWPANLVEFPSALRRVENTIQLKFYDAEIYYDISRIGMLVKAGNHEEAISAATDGLSNATTPALKARMLTIRGDVLGDVGRTDEALKDLKSALLLDAANAEVRVDYGCALLSTDRFTEALDAFSKAIELNPNLGQAYLNRSVARWKTGDRDAAVDDSTAAIDRFPDGVEKAAALLNRGNQLIELGLNEKAVADLAEAASLHEAPSEKAMCLTRRAIALKAAGRAADAIDSLNEAIDINPTDSEAHATRGQFRLENGETSSALSDLDIAIKRAPDPTRKAELLWQGAILYSNLSRFTEANKRFERAHRLQPNNPSILLDKGISLVNQGNLPAAIKAFKATLRKAPTNPKALNNLGICLELQGKHKEAISAYRRGLTASREDFNVSKIYRNMAVSLAAVGKYSEAEGSLERAESIEPKHLRTQVARSRVEFHRGNYERSVEILRPLGPELRPFISPSLLAMGHEQQALALLKTWLASSPPPLDRLIIRTDLQVLRTWAPSIPGLNAAISLLVPH